LVSGGRKKLKGSGEGKAFGASGGEEIASYSERGCAKSYEAGGEIHIHHSKAAVEAQLAIGKIASDSKASWLRVRKGEGEIGGLFNATDVALSRLNDAPWMGQLAAAKPGRVKRCGMSFGRDTRSRRTDRTPDYGESGRAAAKPWMVKRRG
jgi:hypothetical protein